MQQQEPHKSLNRSLRSVRTKKPELRVFFSFLLTFSFLFHKRKEKSKIQSPTLGSVIKKESPHGSGIKKESHSGKRKERESQK